MNLIDILTNSPHLFYTGLLIGRGKKFKFRRFFRGKFAEKAADSMEFLGQTSPKSNLLKTANFVFFFSGQILLEIDQFCTDQTSFFNAF